MSLDPQEARRIVVERYPRATVWQTKTRYTIRTPQWGGMTVLSGYMETEDKAWLSAARRIERTDKAVRR